MFKQWFGLILVSFGGQSLGTLIGTCVKDFKTASALSPVIFFPMILYSGFYADSDIIWVGTSWFQYLSLVRYALEYILRVEFDGAGWTPDPISSYGFNIGEFNCFIILIAYNLILRIFSGLMLWKSAGSIDA